MEVWMNVCLSTNNSNEVITTWRECPNHDPRPTAHGKSQRVK